MGFAVFGGEIIPDIKEKQPIKATIKKKVTALPKELARRGAKQLREEIKEAAQHGLNSSEESQQASPEASAHIPHNMPQRIAKRIHAPPKRAVTRQEQTRTKEKLHWSEQTVQPIKPDAVEQGRELAKEKAVQRTAEQKRAAVRQPAKNSTPVRISEPPRTAGRTLSQRAVTDKTAPKALDHRATTPKTKTKSIKSAEHTVKTAKTPIKTAASAAPQKAARATTGAVHKVGKETARMTQRTARKAIQKALKAIRAGAKSLMAALGAGGAAVVMIVILLCLIGGLLASPFGIFFSGEGEGAQTVQSVLAQLNSEFSDKITEIENSVPHDDVQQTGTRASQKNVLAVYAVKVTTDPDDPLDAVTMDDRRAEILRRIFWDMNQISHSTEAYTEEENVTVTDAAGNETEETQTVERTRLIITISGKTAEQMAQEYGFTQEQLDYLAELLSDDYEELWYGLPAGGGSDDIVQVALSQVGNVGGQPYWSWYGYLSRVAWCACFVSWCGDQCGYIESGAMPKFANCDAGISWFRAQGQWQGRGYVPNPGDIIFFNWDGDHESDHVGIVESSDGATVYTVEGNANDACKRLSYVVGDYRIIGYGKLRR